MVGRLLLAHQAWAHQEDIRRPAKSSSQPPTLTFGGRTRSPVITPEKCFPAPLASFAGLVGCRAFVSRSRVMQHAGDSPPGNNSIINPLLHPTTQQQPATTNDNPTTIQQSDNNQRQQHSDGEEHSIILGRLALKHDEAGRWTIGSTDQSGRWARKDLPQRHVAPWSVARKGTRWWFPPMVASLLSMIEQQGWIFLKCTGHCLAAILVLQSPPSPFSSSFSRRRPL